MRRDRLHQLAGAVADRTPIAWEAVRDETGEPERPFVEALELVDEVARLSLAARAAEPGDAEEGPRDEPPVRRFRDLEVFERLGHGSGGAVYRARDVRLDREVALKLVPAARADRAGEAIREGQLLAKIRHPNVATVFGADEEDGRVGVWMERIEGRTLREVVEEDGPRSAGEATAIGLDLCRALAAVHSAGLVHRDVKAQNALREDGGRIVLVDFGIGLEGGDDDGGRLRGTPAYLAPELLAGEPASARSDVYALGVLLHYLVSGRLPVMTGPPGSLVAAPPRPLRDCRPDLPEAFVKAVEGALAADPAERTASAGELERALGASLEAKGKGARRRRRAAWAGVAVVAALAAGLYLRERPRRESARLLAEARERYAAERTEEAAALLEAALGLDPENAMAYRQLAICQNNLGRFEEALSSASRAFALRDRVGSGDAARIEGAYHFDRLEYEAALAAYRRAVLLDPGDSESRRQLAHLHAQLGDLPAAVAAAREARDRDPASVHTAGLLIVLLAQSGQEDEALAELAASRDALAPGHYLHWGEGLAWLGKGELERAHAAFDALARGHESYANYARLYQAQGQILAGRLEDAAHALEAERGTDARRGFAWSAALRRDWLARLEVLLGRPQAALAALAEVDALPEVPIHLKTFRRAAALRAELGDDTGARRLLDRLERLRRAYPSSFADGAAAHVRGALALAADPERALAELATARRLLDDLPSLVSLAAATPGPAEAARLWREVAERRGEAMRYEASSIWVLAHLELARRRRAAGDLAGARASYDRFLALWRDPALAPVAAAAAERAALEPDGSLTRTAENRN